MKFSQSLSSKLDYSSIYIEPQYSTVLTRKEVDTSTNIGPLTIKTPVISANMDTVTDGTMANAIAEAGAIGAIHRFMSIEQNILEFQKVISGQTFVSIGVNEESKERFKELLKAGASNFIVDIAHGHSLMMRNILEWIRGEYGTHPYIVAGNIATPQGAEDLVVWGADAVKIGIGPGKVCLTKNVTGVTVPQASAIFETCKVKGAVSAMSGHEPVFIADGGIAEIGDIAKAIALGADVVMCGRLFAGAKEAPGARVEGKKVYRGMASRDAMLTIKESNNLPTPEGMSTLIEDTDVEVAEIVGHIKGGLQSAFSYSNARTLKEFQKNCIIGSRKGKL